MKKSIILLFVILCSVSLYSADLVLNNFNDITCYKAQSGAWGSTWSTTDGTGKITVPANNVNEYIYFSLPALFNVSSYKYLKISVKSTETNYRFVPILLTPAWTGSTDVSSQYKYNGAGAWQDIYIPLSGMTAGSAGTYDKIALQVAANDAKPSFDMYIDNVTFVEAYVPDYTRNVTVCNFDNVNSSVSAWSGPSISTAINPSGAGNVGLVSVPTSNAGGISFTAADKINTSTHNKIRFKVYATQAFTFTYVKLEDKAKLLTGQQISPNPAYTTPNQWQEITIDISSATTNSYDVITLMPAAWSGLPAFTFYIDDLTLVKTPIVSYGKKSLYFDFGPTATTGANDPNKTWNSLSTTTANTEYPNLVDSTNTATTYKLTITTAFTGSNTGAGNGGLVSPEVAQLGIFAIASATSDYFYCTSSSFKITGLDQNKVYVFSFFGSRTATTTRTTKFSLVGSNVTAVEGTQTTTGLAIGTVGGAAYDANTNSIYTSTPITPDGTGAIKVTVTKTAGSYAHLNLMRMMESNGITLAATASKTTSDADFSPATASSGLPITYSSSNIAVATIVSGQVHIVGAGTTTITAYQAGNASFDAAAEVSQVLTVTRPVVNVSGSLASADITPSSNVTVSSTGTLTLDASRSINNITVDKGGKLTINNGVNLSAMDVTIYSDETGTGTLLDLNTSGGLSVAGTATVQQYLTAGRNWYISSPVNAATAAVFNPAGGSNKLYWYDETKGSVVLPATPWTPISLNSTGLTATQGYVANMAADGVVSFSGTLNTGSLPTTTIYRSDIPSNAGFNLVGNPYPSYLDWDQVSAASTHLLTTIWQRTKTIDNATYQFDTYNTLGKMYISNSGKTVNSHIPPMQAFWVRVDNGYSSGTLNFTNAMRSHKGSQNTGTVETPNVITDPIFKSKSTNTVSQSVLRLQVSKGTNTDETVIYCNPDASNSYDTYDSPKMFNNSASIAEIYTLACSEQLAINGLKTIPYDTEIPLGFNTLSSGTYSIKASQFSNFETGTGLILKDNLDMNNPVITDLSDGSSYSFTSAIATNNTSRFTLTFRAPSITTGIDAESNSNVWISTPNGQIVINGTTNGAVLDVFNAIGQKIISKNLTGTTVLQNNNLLSGVYLLKITNEGKRIMKKIIVD
ncbi:MAG: T9SS type A sorting domain-containing protein [Paludibacter sp.]